MTKDPREAIETLPMHRLQIGIVVLCIALNALDGFDVLAISFAAPGIADDWQIDRAMLGIVLSMELIGMALGSVLIGNLADRIGRRPTILICLTIMGIGMFLAAIATGVAMLSVTRLLTGLGIGGMLSSTSAMVAEFSNAKRRSLNMVLNIAGYSMGAIVGGTVASALLALTGDWRSVFLFGGAVTVLFIPLAFFYLPESIDLLVARRTPSAVSQINRTLARLDREQINRLPDPPAVPDKPLIGALFSPRYAPLTTLLTVAYFAQIMVFYYIQKWTPKIVVDMGFEASEAGGVLVSANIGGLLGAIAIGLASQRFQLRPAIIVAMLAGFAMIAVYGLGHRDLVQLSIVAALAGFFINAGVVGMYPIFAETFPATLRGTGTGFVIGVGRGGSALAPVVAGALFASGSGLLLVSLTMGAGALVAASMLVLLPTARAISARARSSGAPQGIAGEP